MKWVILALRLIKSISCCPKVRNVQISPDCNYWNTIPIPNDVRYGKRSRKEIHLNFAISQIDWPFSHCHQHHQCNSNVKVSHLDQNGVWGARVFRLMSINFDISWKVVKVTLTCKNIFFSQNFPVYSRIHANKDDTVPTSFLAGHPCL